MKEIVIVGSGGMGSETAWLIEEINNDNLEWKILGFIDDDISKQNKEIYSYKVLGNIDYLNNLSKDVYVIIAIGNGKTREEVAKKIINKKYATLIHPNVNISKTSIIGEGSIICSGSLISILTSIGKHCIVNFNSIVAHDSILKNYVTLHVNVNISGNVTVGERTIIGSGSSIIQGKKIGSDCMVAIGSSVLNKVKDGSLVLGVPAKKW